MAPRHLLDFGAMRHEFSTREAVAIAAGAPGVTRAPITVSGIGDARDRPPRGDRRPRPRLARRPRAQPRQPERHARRAGPPPPRPRRATSARRSSIAVAPVAIADAAPPFRAASARAAISTDLRGCEVDGDWTLEVDDRAFHDAGAIRGWGLEIESAAAAAPAFVIDVRFKGGLTSAQQAAFTTAAARWARIITADVPSVVVDGETIDDIVIDASGTAIDGPQGILGQAGPTQLRPGSFLPAAGVMEFDTADLVDDGGRRQPRQRHHARDGPRARPRLDLGRARAAPGRRQRQPDVHGRERDARVRGARRRRRRARGAARQRRRARHARRRTGARRCSATSS